MGTIARRIFVTVLLCGAVTLLARMGIQSKTNEPDGQPAPLNRLMIEARPLESREIAAFPQAPQRPDSHLVADASADGSAVRQASFSSLAFVAGAASIGQPADLSAPRILHITDEASPAVRWPVTQNRQEIRVRSQRVTISFSALDDSATIRLQSDNGKYFDRNGREVLRPQAGSPPLSDPTQLDQSNGDLTITLPAERHNLTPIVVGPSGEEQRLLTLSIIPPESEGPTAPTITRVFNNEHDHQVDGVTFRDAASVPVFGDYLRIDAEVAGNHQNLRFSLFKTDGATTFFQQSIVPRTSQVLSNGMISYELAIPRDLVSPGVRGILLPHVIVGGKHAFSPPAQAIHFEVATSVPPLHPPTISAVHRGAPDTLDSTNRAGDGPDPNTWVVIPPTKEYSITGTAATVPSNQRQYSRIILYEQVNGVRTLITNQTTQSSGFEIDGSTGTWRASIPVRHDGDFQYTAHVVQGNMSSPASPPVSVLVRSRGPSVVDVEPRNRLLGDGRINVTIFFSKANPLDSTSAKDVTNYRISGPGIAEDKAENPLSATFDRLENSVTLTFPDYPNDGTFTIFVDKNNDTNSLKDVYGNVLFLDSESDTHYQFTMTRSKLAALPATQPGIVQRTGEYVPFTEFTTPRNVPDGFNPHDKVETRVVRLYYYRDAHRVAQIVNRKVKSFNRQGVDMQRQLADKARADAERRTLERQELERAAIIKAQKTREAENELRAAEATLAQSIGALMAERLQNPEVDPRLDPKIQQLEATINANDQQIQRIRGQVQKLRDDEVAANERAVQAEAHEALARQEQFRREVAAAHADPDTYAAGKPTSDDPVEQVSVSVIGEGLIHLRGPLKGVNQIRTMIDQIDQPVGQVRIAVHTVQINGEKNDRMEVVAKQVQQYIDHARFLTMQSSEMLRRAVVQVASRKAEEARMLYPGETQDDRDRRYLHAFFGRDFIDELESMDSEFLRTGNKLLSLHSMDTTSLSSALNLMALARNSTRLEILEEFDMMLQGQLPIAEANYMAAGMSHCSAKKHGWKCKHPIFCPMAQNAKFESLRGFFNMEIGHDETMTPLQREFIRLAQIFKSRLITELEYKQRVTPDYSRAL